MLRQVALLVCLCLFGFSNAQQKAIAITGCGVVNEVRVNPCNSDPCIFRKGDTIDIEADFTSNQESDSLKLSVGVRVIGIEIDLPGMEGGADGCAGFGISCPIKEGQIQTLKWKRVVALYAPRIKFIAAFKLEGASGNVFCFEAPVQLVKIQNVKQFNIFKLELKIVMDELFYK